MRGESVDHSCWSDCWVFWCTLMRPVYTNATDMKYLIFCKSRGAKTAPIPTKKRIQNYSGHCSRYFCSSLRKRTYLLVAWWKTWTTSSRVVALDSPTCDVSAPTRTKTQLLDFWQLQHVIIHAKRIWVTRSTHKTSKKSSQLQINSRNSQHT